MYKNKIGWAFFILGDDMNQSHGLGLEEFSMKPHP